MDIVTQIEDRIRPILSERRFELVDTQYRRESGRWVLRIFIDRLDAGAEKADSRVTLDDCEKVSDAVGASLDASDLLSSSYVLEVSSPGINRPLKTEDHFRRYVGQNAKISLHEPLDPQTRQRNFSGILLGCENGAVEIMDAVSGKVRIPLAAVHKAQLDLI